jgi:RND family efflux transporter MFP subunit
MRIVILLIVAAVLLQSCGAHSTEKKTIPAGENIPVKLLPIAGDTSVHIINASGLISTEDEARLSFKIGGVIESMLVKEGDKVRKGQLLATLKPVEIAAQVQQVSLGLEKAQRDYQRVQNLYKDSVATLEQLQNAKTAVDLARQNLQQVSFNEQYSKIYAPADGFIVRKSGNTGELATSGTPVLFMNATSSASKWILKAGLSDQEWAAVQTGNKATVTTDAYPGRQFSAVVSKKALAADAASGSFTVEIQVDFGKEQPAVGLFGNAAITGSGRSVGFSIPYEALLEASGSQGYVFVSDDRKTVKKVAVHIASFNNNVVYIADGLQGHAFVVSAGSPYLSDNSTITPQ